MKTIHDYLKMAQELRDLGQQLVQEQYRGSDKPAEWVEELECMNIHLECCIYELSWKQGLTNQPQCDIIKVQKGKEMKTMKTLYYYEIRNTRTQATAEANGHSFQEACASVGWKPWNCRCVYRAEVEED